MDKQTIEFLLKAGYTLSEIIMMDSVTEPPKTDNTTEPPKTDNTTEPPKTDNTTEPPKEKDNSTENLSAQLEALRYELSELREITHNANRRNAVIDNPIPAPTMEEQVEQLMKEVGT